MDLIARRNTAQLVALQDNYLRALSSHHGCRRGPPVPVSEIHPSGFRRHMPDNSDDEFAPERRGSVARKALRIALALERKKPDTSRIDKSELCLMTKLACGIIEQNNSRRNISIASMIQNRLIGGRGFTRGQQCQIRNNYLPNKRHQSINYHCKVYCGSHSSDGKYFVSATEDRLLRLYRTVNGELDVFKIIPARGASTSPVLDTAFSPDGKNVVYSSWTDSLFMFPINGDPSLQQALRLCPEGQKFGIFSVTFSNDGNEVIGSSNDGYLYFYDLTRHERTLRIKAHSKDANAVTFADNTSQILISGSDDGLCKVWDRRMLSELDSQPVGVLAGHKSGITCVDSRRDGRHLITNSKDQTIKLWDMRAFSGAEGIQNTQDAVRRNFAYYRLQRSPNPSLKARTLMEGDTSVMTYRGHTIKGTLIRCRFSPAATTGQRYIYTGSIDGCVFIFDVLSGEYVLLKKKLTSVIRDVSWHPYEPNLVSSSWDGTLETWITAPGEPEEPDDSYDIFHPIWN